MGDTAASIAAWLWKSSWQAAVLVALIFLLRRTVGRKLPPGWKCALWLLVGLRLVCPAPIPTTWSPFNAPQWAHRWRDAAPAVPLQSPESQPDARVTVTTFWDAAPLAASPSPADAGNIRFETAPIFISLWLAGAAVFLSRVIVSHLLLRRRVRQMTPANDPALLRLVDQCAREMRVNNPPRVVQTDHLRSPAVCGLLRPTLILPTVTAQMSPADLRMVLLHEMAHLRRRDVLTDSLASILRALHWFNPAVWLAASAFRADRELACDAAVLNRVTEPERTLYGDCLLRVVEMIGPMRPHPAAVGVFGRKRTLQTRINMIASYTPSPRPAAWSLAGLAAFLIVGCAALTDAKTDPKENSRKIPPAADVKPVEEKPAAEVWREMRVVEDEPQSLSKEDHEAKAKLDKHLPEVSFNATPFTDTINFLREVTALNIFVNWRALEAAGIDQNTPITARMRDVRTSKALQTIIDAAGGGTVKLAFVTDDGVVTVSTQEDLAKNTITRVYDIRDLLVEIPDFLAPNETPVATSTTESARERRAALVAQVTSLIQETVEPDTWRDAGGAIGSIRELSGQLIVTQTPENQRAVASLLGQLRESRGIQVTIEARMLTLDPDAIPDKMKKRLRPMLDPAAEDRAAPAYLSGEEVNDLLHAVQSATDTTLLSMPRVTIFNGQRAQIQVATSKLFTTGYNVVGKTGGETRYEPVVERLDAGVFFDVQATASADLKYVTMTLRPTLKRVEAAAPKPFEGNKDLLVSTPILSEQGIKTTVRVPDGKTAVMRSAPIEEGKKQVLFVLVRPTLIVQREQPQQK